QSLRSEQWRSLVESEGVRSTGDRDLRFDGREEPCRSAFDYDQYGTHTEIPDPGKPFDRVPGGSVQRAEPCEFERSEPDTDQFEIRPDSGGRRSAHSAVR